MTIRKASQLNAETWHQCDCHWRFAEFFAPDDDHWMRHGVGPMSERKARLIMVAALRAVWEWIPNPLSRAAVKAAERYADDPDPAILAAVRDGAYEAMNHVLEEPEEYSPDKPYAYRVACAAWGAVRCPPPSIAAIEDPDGSWGAVLDELLSAQLPDSTHEIVNTRQLRFFHDIVWNPFRPVVFDPAWRTGTAVALARGMYEARDFAAMPILADALQDACCDIGDILDHCRDPHGTHVRGCWVVDLVLRKE